MRFQVIVRSSLFLFCVGLFAQSPRIELLTRSATPTSHRGANAETAVPEVSRNGRFVLFLSLASNLDPDYQPLTAFNLFMKDRVTGETTLVSRGTNGAPANDSILGYQFAANSRRILFETAASNLIPD